MKAQKVLIAVSPGLGTLHVRGNYTGALYEIPSHGTLVHPYDVEGILQQEKTFCCGPEGNPITKQPFHVGRATLDKVEYVEIPEEVKDVGSPEPPVEEEKETKSKALVKEEEPPADGEKEEESESTTKKKTRR